MKQPNDHVRGGQMSRDGRYVLLTSSASNLVPHDTHHCAGTPDQEAHNCSDVFVRDMGEGSIERISVSSAGRQGNDDSGGSDITPDGRYIVFTSNASNLDTGDTNRCFAGESGITPCLDVFVHDRVSHTTSRVSVASSGEEADDASGPGAISADGRFVVFISKASNLVSHDGNTCSREDHENGGVSCEDVFLHDRKTDLTTLVSVSSDGTQANGPSTAATISDDGRYIAFLSISNNLTPDRTSGVFLRDRVAGTTTLVSVPIEEGQGIHGMNMSGDGKIIIYTDNMSSYVYDHSRGRTQKIRGELGRQIWTQGVSRGGRYVVLWSNGPVIPSDRNSKDDCYVLDRSSGSLALISPSDEGTNWVPEECAISPDGGTLAIVTIQTVVASDTNRFGDVYLIDRETREVVRASQP